MKGLNFFLGTSRLSFSEADRTQVYQSLLSERIQVLSAENRSDGFWISLFSADAKRLQGILNGTGVSVKNEVKKGLPVLLKRLLRRCGLLLGLFLGLSLFLFCRSRVWEIQVLGSGPIDPDLLIEELSEFGLREGVSFRELDFDTVCFEMQKLDRRIAWMQIRREGVKVIVEWIPTKKEDLSLQSTRECGANLVARKDAVIVDLQIESGEASVSVGSVVHAGELLVSGVGSHSAVYASGRVIGRVREQVSVRVPFKSEEIVTVANEGVGFSVELFGRRLSFGESEGDLSDRATAYLFGKIRLPIFWERVYRAEYTVREIKLSESDAAKAAGRLLSERLAVLLAEGELLSSSVTASYDDEGYTLTADIEYLINIAKTLEFSLENE